MLFSAFVIWLAVCMAFYTPAYILTGLGLYSIAARRGIERPGLAWVPGVNLYTLGCISDQYQAMVRGKNRNKRTWLLLLVLGLTVATGILFVRSMEQADTISMVGFLMLFVPVWCMMAALSVITFMALYDLYVSCDPKHAVLCLVLSILFGFTMPVFLFLCRKKDLGFPL